MPSSDNRLTVILILFGMWLFIFLAFTAYTVFRQPANLNIWLETPVIEQGTNLGIGYRVSSWWPFGIDNLKVTTSVVGEETLVSEEYTHVSFLDPIVRQRKFPTQELPSGNYTARIEFVYESVFGRKDSVDLTLGFQMLSFGSGHSERRSIKEEWLH